MRYLTVDADYGSTGLRDEFEGGLEPRDLGVPDDLCADLERFVLDYSGVVVGTVERSPDVVARLDEQGVLLTQRLRDHFGPEAKVRYYSEGLLRHID